MQDSPGSPILIVQITDTHLYAKRGGRLLGLDTDASLAQVIGLVRQRHDPDLIVASGDLSHDATAPAYTRVREHFAALDAPVYCLPGNHDESRALRQTLDQPPFYCRRKLSIDGWQMLFLDSTVSGSEGGHLSTAELAAMDRALTAFPHSPALVWLHHQPLPIGSAWLDVMAVDNPEAFFSVIDRHPQVRAVIWGHVHQVYDARHGDVRLLATPSSCIQFLPGSAEFAIDTQPPGYRWLTLYPDGRLETGVERLARIPGEIDLSQRGYS